MHIRYLSIFPEIFDSFLNTSLVAKSSTKGITSFKSVNARDFCLDKHKQIDDEPYGGGAGLVIKAEPIIQGIKSIYEELMNEEKIEKNDIVIIHCTPSRTIFNQSLAHEIADGYKGVIFVCGRYEGVDDRVNSRGSNTYGEHYKKISLGEFITLGGEIPAMVMSEAIIRLIPGVIKEQESWMNESYRPEFGGKNIEHPQYTRPQIVEGYKIPEVLLSGNHKHIEERRNGFIT